MPAIAPVAREPFSREQNKVSLLTEIIFLYRKKKNR